MTRYGAALTQTRTAALSVLTTRTLATEPPGTAVRETPVGRHSAEPVGLRADRRACQIAGHTRVYSILCVADFPSVHREVARFSDLDPMGHVNNAVYLTWIENARIDFLRRLGAFDRPDTAEMAMILARVELDFRAPVCFGDEIEVGVRTARLGTKSFDLDHEVWAGDRLVAEAKSVLVGYDYDAGTSVPLTENQRSRLTE